MLKFLTMFFAVWVIVAEANGFRAEAVAILGMAVVLLCTDALVDVLKKRGA